MPRCIERGIGFEGDRETDRVRRCLLKRGLNGDDVDPHRFEGQGGGLILGRGGAFGEQIEIDQKLRHKFGIRLAIARRGDKIRQHVGGPQQDVHGRCVRVKGAAAHQIQHGLEGMGETDQRCQAEGPRATLDRMDGAKDIVDRLHLVVQHCVRDACEPFAHAEEQIFALFEEGRAE